MYKFGNISDINYSVSIINEAYKRVTDSKNNSAQIPVHNQSLGVLPDLHSGDIAAIRRNAGDTSTAISIIQIFTEAIETITEKLIRMMELAKKALEPYYSHLQTDSIQQHLQKLAEEVNQIVNSMEYNLDKPLAESGKTFSIPVGNGLKINIRSRNFRFDAKDINIETYPQKTLLTVKEAISNANVYKTHLTSQSTHLKDIMAAVESDIQGSMGMHMWDFQTELALPMADYAASLIQQDKQTSLNTQANFSSEEILKLLKAT